MSEMKLTYYTAQRCLSEAEKKYLRGSFQFNIVTFLKYIPTGNLNFNNFGIFQSLKLRIFVGKIFSISLKP